MPPLTPLQTIALVAGVLYGLLALTLWLLLRRRHPAVPLALWVAGAVLAGLALSLLGLHALMPPWLGPGLAFQCLLGAMLLRTLSLRMELGLPQRASLALGAWLLGGLIDLAAGTLPYAPVRLLLSAMMLMAAAVVFARHAIMLGQMLGSRLGHGLAATESLLVLAIMLRTAVMLLQGDAGSAGGQAWDLVAAVCLAVLAALFGNLGYLGLALERSRTVEQVASAVQWEERLRREAAEDRTASLRDLLHQRDALASERDQLLKLLAHEIRQPLHNASGALQAARAALGEPGPERLPRAGERLQRAQGVLADVRSVLDNTLAAANLLGGGDALYVPDTALMPLLQQVLADLPEAQRRLVQVPWREIPDTAELEAGLVRLALRNLLRNAFNHGGPAVSVLIKCERQPQPPALVIKVIDDGVGPPPDWEPAVGGRPRDATGRSPARGLGLHIVREVMARHGGSLHLQPRQPHGLIAQLLFPQQRLAMDNAA